ncbi:MAG: transpeptidase family protein [Fidelibacterota bacterium]|nr:MAG: transpeptidase family protein [Candidatus Neomarinimicrobiota bacterium]
MTRLYLQHRARVILVTTIMAGFLLTVTGKLFYIQILNHSTYRSKAELQSTDVKVLPAARGHIEDRNGDLLTSNIMHFSFAVDPQVLDNADEVINLFARVFNRPVADYRKRLTADRSFVWLERNVPRSRCEQLLDFQSRGLIVQREVRRRYPYGHLIAPVVGFTDVDNQGISGLEHEFDTFLRGENGWQVLRRDAKGRVIPHATKKGQPARHGSQLQLTIDMDYQSIFQEEMERASQRLVPKTIHGILMEPITGEILALAQYPSFDPNAHQASPSENQRIKAITDLYEPGSTLKVVTATAALEENFFSPLDEIDCEGGEYKYHNLTIKDVYPQGVLSVSEIIAYSSNIGIIKMAENIGRELLYKYCRWYGLGTRTGIGLLGESPGLLRDLDSWSSVSTGEIAMGQEIGVTTLQLALVYSAIANGGLLMRPLLVKQVYDSGRKEFITNTPETIRRVASSEAMDQLRRILHYAVEQGTGNEARLPGYTVAGKTGTAQKYLDGRYSDEEFVATFAAMFPAERPRLVCVVAVDSPRYGTHFGGEAAAPIVRNTLKRILNLDDNFYVPPPPPVVEEATRKPSPYLLASAGTLPAPLDPGIMPDFRGLSLRKALHLARKSGVRLQVEGSGRVVKQSIKSGTLVDYEEVCIITLAPERHIQ